MNVKKDFPVFTSQKDLVYLDSAATTQKPQMVIDAIQNIYKNGVANPHRGIYDMAQHATELFEGTRAKVAAFIGATEPEEIVFTSGTTEGINLVAESWARSHLQPGDIIITTEMEHHSNLLPWLRLRDDLGIEIVYLPFDDDYRLDYKNADIAFEKVRLIAMTHASNVLGTVNPIANIVTYFKEKSPGARFLIDAAQSVSHIPINVQDLDVDFLAFSAHKMLGPSGVGVLYVKSGIVDELKPYQRGGQMIRSVSKDDIVWAEPPHKFEAGTQNLEGVAGLGAAIDYLQNIGFEAIAKHNQELVSYGLEQLAEVDMYGPKTAHDRLAIFSFNVSDIHAHDVAEILNRHNVAIRAGHHCAETLMRCMDVNGTARASLHVYNSKEDIDALVRGLNEVKKVMKR